MKLPRLGVCRLTLPGSASVLSQPVVKKLGQKRKQTLKLSAIIIFDFLPSQKNQDCLESTLMLKIFKMPIFAFSRIIQKSKACNGNRERSIVWLQNVHPLTSIFEKYSSLSPSLTLGGYAVCQKKNAVGTLIEAKAYC